MLCSLIVCLSRVHVIPRPKELQGGRTLQISGCVTQNLGVVLGVRKDLPVAGSAGESSYQAGFVVVIYVQPISPRLAADGAYAALVAQEGLIFARFQAVGVGHTSFV